MHQRVTQKSGRLTQTHNSQITFPSRMIKIGPKVVRYSRKIVFQMAKPHGKCAEVFEEDLCWPQDSASVSAINPLRARWQQILVATALLLLASDALAQPVISSVYPPVLSDRLGDHVAYSVSATASSGTLSYAWHQTNNATVLSSSNTLVLTNIQSSNAGAYYVVVTDGKGSTQSANVVLNVQSCQWQDLCCFEGVLWL
jgi:hypothetical protein